MPDIRVTLEPKTHADLKSLAAQKRVSLKQFIIDLIVKAVRS